MTSNPFSVSDPQICASILSASFGKLGAEIDDALRGGADFVHLDIMDGHFVPNISFGPPVVRSIRPLTRAYFDAHLMVSDPLRYAGPMVKAGAQNVCFHVEAVADPVSAARQIRNLGCHVGVTLKPATSVESLWPVLDEVDMVLVMTVNPGFSGQAFMPEGLPKCRAIKQRLRPNQRLQIDGGINADTIRAALDAGVDWFVVASAIFDAPNRAAAIAQLRAKLGA
jgi:ribulose-phosphate 3-epimerase